jgi:hypothetical protein
MEAVYCSQLNHAITTPKPEHAQSCLPLLLAQLPLLAQ